MKLVRSRPKENEYSIYYRANRVFKDKDAWYFEDENGEPFGPFDSKDKTMQAVRIYRDVKLRGVQLPFNRIKEVL